MTVTWVINGEIVQWEATPEEYEATKDKEVNPEIARLRDLTLEELLSEEFPF